MRRNEQHKDAPISGERIREALNKAAQEALRDPVQAAAREKYLREHPTSHVANPSEAGVYAGPSIRDPFASDSDTDTSREKKVTAGR